MFRNTFQPGWLLASLAALALALPGARNGASSVASAAAAETVLPLNARFTSAGLAGLDWQGSGDLLQSANVELQDLKFAGGQASGSDFSRTSSRFDQGSRTLVDSYNWGAIRIQYRPDSAAGGLHLSINVSNTGYRSITRLGLYVLKWKMPAAPAQGWNGADILLHTRADDFPIVTVNWDGGRAALCSDEVAEPFTFGDQPLGKGAQDVLVRYGDQQPIAPHDHQRAELSIRFATAQETTEQLVGDVLRNYAARYPATLNWPDRRPIGSAFLSTSAAGYKHNPRGWLQDPQLDTTTPAGREAFARAMFAYADSVVAHCRKMNAQGVIVWDIEGQEMPHATSYLADPRMLAQVAPEMDPLADRFFRRFSSAGLRTGVTIRPTRVEKNDKGPGWMQAEVADPVAEMDSKITYAQKRWGCTLFYLDSNVTYVMDKAGKILDNPPMPAEYFQTLAKHHPGCLLMPEHKTDRYYAYVAPYSEFRLGFDGTPEMVRLAYPHAFSVMRVVDGPSLSAPDSVAKLTAAITNGDVLLFRPWWDDPQTSDIQHLYSLARSPNR